MFGFLNFYILMFCIRIQVMTAVVCHRWFDTFTVFILFSYSQVTRVSTCVGDRLTPPTRTKEAILKYVYQNLKTFECVSKRRLKPLYDAALATAGTGCCCCVWKRSTSVCAVERNSVSYLQNRHNTSRKLCRQPGVSSMLKSVMSS